MSRKRREPPVILICEGCGVEYSCPSYLAPTRHFHSNECRLKSHKIWQSKAEKIGNPGFTNFEVEFWKRVDKSTGFGPNGDCWQWMGSLNKHNGYGYATVSTGKIRRAHIYSYKLKSGCWPEDGMCVMHSCDNKLCVNPEHLSLGTTQENTADRDKKGRTSKGEHRYNAILTEELVRKLRSEYIPRKMSAGKLAAKYGLTKACVGNILWGKGWKHIK